jgi:hypothetical protein
MENTRKYRKYLNVHEVKVVSGAQNRLRVLEKYLNLFGEYAK